LGFREIAGRKEVKVLVDQERLNRFLAVDWKKVTQEIHEINEGIKTLERLADAIEKLEDIIDVFYEEKYGVLKAWKPRLFDIEVET